MHGQFRRIRVVLHGQVVTRPGPRWHGGDVQQEGEGAWTRGVRHASLKLGSGFELAFGSAERAVDGRQVIAVILGSQSDERRIEGWRTSPSGLRAAGRGGPRRPPPPPPAARWRSPPARSLPRL